MALPQGDVDEVIAGRTALLSLEGIQLALVDEAPLLKPQPERISADVLLQD